jgi:hypothetical protein
VLLMKKLGLILLATTLLLSPVYSVKADSWVEVARFQGGTGGLVVSEEHFTCNYGEWRIRWEFSLSKFSSAFLPTQYTLTVVTYREGEEDHLVAPRIYEMANGTRSGTSYVHDSYGRYYMLIRSTDLESYTITIEQNTDYRLGPTLTPTSTPSPTATPTPSPTEEPQTVQFETILGLGITAAAISAGIGLLIYIKKRKR